MIAIISSRMKESLPPYKFIKLSANKAIYEITTTQFTALIRDVQHISNLDIAFSTSLNSPTTLG